MKNISVSRKELKYVIGYEDYYKLQQTLGAILERDGNGSPYGYKVRSLYFDSFNNDDYYAKMSGEETRKKIRLRIYDRADTEVKLEIKRKYNTDQIKETTTISKQDALALIEGNYEVLLQYESPIARTAYHMMILGYYRPVVLIEYDRVAFMHPENKIRLTFDNNIYASETHFDLFCSRDYLNPVFPYFKAVLEVKYDGELFNWISQILTGLAGNQESVSKYCCSRQFFDNYLA